MTVTDSVADVSTPTGPMRTYFYAPHDPHGAPQRPGLVLYSEIFQQTPPVRRACPQLRKPGVSGCSPGGVPRARTARVRARLRRRRKESRQRTQADHRHVGLRRRRPRRGRCPPEASWVQRARRGGRHLPRRAPLLPRRTPAGRAGDHAPCFYPTDIHSGTLGTGGSDFTRPREGHSRGTDDGVRPARAHTSQQWVGVRFTKLSTPPACGSRGTSSTPRTHSCATKASATTRRQPDSRSGLLRTCSGGVCEAYFASINRNPAVTTSYGGSFVELGIQDSNRRPLTPADAAYSYQIALKSISVAGLCEAGARRMKLRRPHRDRLQLEINTIRYQTFRVVMVQLLSSTGCHPCPSAPDVQ